jgi:hypothetical protein
MPSSTAAGDREPNELPARGDAAIVYRARLYAKYLIVCERSSARAADCNQGSGEGSPAGGSTEGRGESDAANDAESEGDSHSRS